MLGWPTDEGQLSKMKAANEKELAKMEEKIKDAEENLGDIEVFLTTSFLSCISGEVGLGGLKEHCAIRRGV